MPHHAPNRPAPFRLACTFAAVLAAAAAHATPLDALTRQLDYDAARASSTNPDLARNNDARGIDPGGELVLADLEGPGVVTQFWHTINTPNPFYGRELVLKIYYDNRDTPSVAVPLGDFFVQPHGYVHRDFTSDPVVVSSYGRSRTCYWRMPFRQRLRMTVVNESDTHRVSGLYWQVNWQRRDTLPDDTVYFHARYQQAYPAEPGPYVVLETSGRGHYAGTACAAWQMDAGWFGEGDDFFTVDGAERPQLTGSGTEDYFGEAWGFHGHDAPYTGVPLYEGVVQGDQLAVYRWHLPDPVPFRESLRFTLEHRGSVFDLAGGLANFEVGNFVERPDWLSSVAYWYQWPPAEAPALPPVAERMPPVRVLQSAALNYTADPPLVVVPQDGGVGYFPSQTEAEISFEVPLDEPGTYRFDAVVLRALMNGVWQPYLNETPIGAPLDLCIKNLTPDVVRLDTHRLEAGTHTLRFVSTGERPAARRALAPWLNGFGLVRLYVLRLDDMRGFGAAKAAARSQ